MFLLGTELFFAFWMASKRVGFPSGSAPPVRAATSMFLISLAKSLPRLASITAFLCLVVAHLEWPDTASLLRRHRHEQTRRSYRQPQSGPTGPRPAPFRQLPRPVPGSGARKIRRPRGGALRP